MSHRIALLLVLPALALVGAFGAVRHASAQLPPDYPVVYYGEVSNGVAGATVKAYVSDGGSLTECGTGLTLLEGSKVVYAVSVAGDGQKTGCGKAGRQVKLTFKAPSELGARPATQTVTWGSIGVPYRFNVTLGDPPAIARRAAVPGLSHNP